MTDELNEIVQYFVTRVIAATTDPDNIFPTMAHQLAEKSPLAALVIQDKLETTPFSVVEKISHGMYKGSSISQAIVYPCEYLGHHLENGGERSTLVRDVDKFMKTCFLRWLEVLSLLKLVEVAISTLKIFEKQIKVSIHLLTKYGY